METNWIIVGMLLLGVLVLIAFLVRKDQKDKKKYTDFLNKDYKKTAEEDSDLDDDTY
jgi:uncharacterized membrane protein YukC